jgi:predicted negative regulator of RcsB-dependent stress response
MARHPSSRRVPHGAADPDDVFLTRVLEFTAWSRQNARAIIIAAVIAAVVALGALFYFQHQRTQEERAAAQLNEIRQTAAAGNRALAVRDLVGLLGRFDGTEASREARIMLARLQLEEGHYAEAGDAVAALARRVDRPLGPAAAGLLAAAYEGLGDLDAAVQVHLRIAERARFGYQRRNALETAAELRMTQGNAAEAANLYERLLRELPEDADERPVVEMRLAEARARAGA